MLTEDERLQIDRLTSRAVDRSARQISDKLNKIYASHAAKGTLGSGATIRAAIQQMEAEIRETMTGLLDDVSTVCRTSEAFAEIDDAVQLMLAAAGEKLPAVVRKTGNQPGSSATSAALGLYRTMKMDIEADLLIARYDFETAKTRRPLTTNKGGKPLAAHWDDMWSAIAVQLWTGDLKPKTQADIKRAMQDWLSANEIDAGETSVTERARQLWLKIEAAQ